MCKSTLYNAHQTTCVNFFVGSVHILCVECVCMCAYVYMVCMMQYACSGSVLACMCSMCMYRMCVCLMHSVFVVNIKCAHVMYIHINIQCGHSMCVYTNTV